MNPYILELGLVILVAIGIGVAMTQFVVPTLTGHKTWELFRGGPSLEIDKVNREIEEEKQIAVLEEKLAKLKKMREERKSKT